MTHISADAIFVSEQTNQIDLLSEIYHQLIDLGAVKGDFLSQVLHREQHFPTGLKTDQLGVELPNIALPHTEGQFVTSQLIVPVALKNPVVFHHLVNPSETLEVSFLFVLLDTKPDGQAQLLADVMAFLAQTPVNSLRTFLNLKDPAAIGAFLTQHSSL